jgi:hypothetical protein
MHDVNLVGKTASILAMAVLGFLDTSIAASQPIHWREISCSDSRLVAPVDAKCEAAGPFGSSDGHAQFDGWLVRSDKPYTHIRMSESRTSVGHIRFDLILVDWLKRMDDRARSAKTFFDRRRFEDADYVLFVSDRAEECVGFRRGGTARSVGYKWTVTGVQCLPRGTPLGDAEAAAFMRVARRN